jgi:hypothetical protein
MIAVTSECNVSGNAKAKGRGIICGKETSPATPCAASGLNGEGGIRTHGTVTRTTVFETAPSQTEIGGRVNSRWLQVPATNKIKVLALGQDLAVQNLSQTWNAVLGRSGSTLAHSAGGVPHVPRSSTGLREALCQAESGPPALNN